MIVTQYKTRGQAVYSLGAVFGKQVRELVGRKHSAAEIRDAIAKQIDLDWLPPRLAEKYLVSDRAWHRFLNDIIAESGEDVR